MSKNKLDVRRYLRGLAGWTWNRQAQALSHGLSLQEETLTEMLLLKLAKSGQPLGLRTRMFTRKEESRNGADWEWYIRSASCTMRLRVQAKRLYANGKYDALKPSGSQCGKLIKQAGKAQPLYIFFNHGKTRAFSGLGSHGFKGPSFWGCAFAKAKDVQTARSNDPAKLAPYMRPWHELFDTCLRGSRQNQRPGIDAPAPDWVDMLGNDDVLDAYLDQHDLAGVALIDATDVQLD